MSIFSAYALPFLTVSLVCLASYFYAMSIKQKSVRQFKYIAAPLAAMWSLSAALSFMVGTKLSSTMFIVLSVSIFFQFVLVHLKSKITSKAAQLAVVSFILSFSYLVFVDTGSNVGGIVMWASLSTLLMLYIVDKISQQPKVAQPYLYALLAVAFSSNVLLLID